MGRCVIAESPAVMESLGVGSCVIVCLYDPVKKVGGMAHIMLSKSPTNAEHDDTEPAKYADRGIKRLLAEMIQRGAAEERIESRIAGGAEMFQSFSGNLSGIGQQNSDAVRSALRDAHIPIRSADIGGSVGRSVRFLLDSGDVEIRKKI